MARTVALTWNLDTGKLSAATDYLKRGENVSFVLTCYTGSAKTLLPTSWALILALKPYDDYDSAPLVNVNGSWTEAAVAKTYTSPVTLISSSAIDTLLAKNADGTDDIDEYACVIDVNYTVSGLLPIKTDTLEITLKNDVARSDDASPTTVGPDDEWVAHGHAQTLTAGQKLQASTNLGLNLTASKLLGQASSGGTGLPVAITLGSGLTMTASTLSASASSGLTVGTTAITSGTATRLLYETSGNLVGEISGATSDGTTLTLVAPVLGTPASGVLTNCTGTAAGLTAGVASAVAVGGITGLGTGVGTALAVNVGSAGALVTNGGALGTPSSGTLTNCTGLPNAGVVGLGTMATQAASAIAVTGGTAAGLTGFGLRDTGAAFDLTIQATGTGMSAARTLILDCGNVAHTVALGTTAGTITFPNIAAMTVAGLQVANVFTAAQTITETVGASALTLTGATQTSSFPVINATQTWNNAALAFTGIKLNVTSTGSLISSALIDLQIGGTGYFRIFRDGATQFGVASASGAWGTLVSAATITIGRPNGTGGIDSGTEVVEWVSNNPMLCARGNFSLGTTAAARDAILARDAAASIQMGVDVNGAAVNQTFKAHDGITGTDVAGASLTIAGGRGTGAGTGASVILSTATTLATGITAQTLVARLTLSRGAVTTDAATLTFADALDFVFNTTTGTKIGTGTTQKIGFYNATPVVQPTHIADPSGGAVIDAEARTAINSILAWQATLGLTAAA